MALIGGTGRRDGRDDRPVIDVGAATATGPRADNQDRWAAGGRWAVVSDGAGGHAGGARAAELTVAAARAVLAEAAGRFDAATLVAAARQANLAVVTGRRIDPEVASMAATLTIAVAVGVDDGASRWLVANVGDSPAWRLTPAGPQRVTCDHNLAAELVRAGVLSAEDARTHPGRHRITRAIGIEDAVEPDVATVDLQPGDALVLASDGVEVLEDRELGDLLLAVGAGTGAAGAARLIVETAVARGASDNVTVVVLRHLSPP